MSANPRVLYVDDDADSREMLGTLLRFRRIDTKAVGTAAQALSLIQDERFDLYLLDAWLPDLDGYELCRLLRSFDPQTPILFFSGAAYEADVKRGMEAGANAYVSKPDVEGLLGYLAQLVSNEEPIAPDNSRRTRKDHVYPSVPVKVQPNTLAARRNGLTLVKSSGA